MEKVDHDQLLKSHKVSVLGLDGLPGVRLKRLQSDSVKCIAHDVIFKLSDAKMCSVHNSSNCQIGWLFHDKIILLGESHEEIFMNLRAASADAEFGLRDVLKELGKKSRMNQEAAIKKKELNKLFPINLLFIEGSLKMLMTSYVESNWEDKSLLNVENFIKFCMNHSNPLVTYLFLAVHHFMMPCLVKRLGLRLNRIDIADAVSALGEVTFL